MPSTYNGLSEEWYFQLDPQILHVISTRLMLRAIPSYSTSLREIRSEETFATGYFLLRNAIRLCSLIKFPSQNHISITEYPVDLSAIADDKLVITTENLYQFIISSGPKSDAGSIFWANIISDLLDSGIQSNLAPVALEADITFARSISKPNTLWDMPLFSDVSEDYSPQNIEYEITLLLEVLTNNGPEMQFWRDWYQGFLNGKPLDWNLQREVALIPDEDWEKGPAHIADMIEDIRKKYEPKPIDPAKLHKQAAQLIAHPEATQMTANGLARQIDDAITQFMKDAECNSLPDEFAVLERIPPLLRMISKTVILAKDNSEYEKELEKQIEVLAAEIVSLKGQLIEANANTLTGVLSKNIIEQAGKSIGDWKMWGAIIAGSWVLLGQPVMGNVLDEIPAAVCDVFPEKSQPALKPPAPPSKTTDV